MIRRKKPCILYRESVGGPEEVRHAEDYFRVYRTRCQVPCNSIVFGRYSVLPFYRELEEDLAHSNSQLINSYNQHLYVADLKNWYQDLHDITPKTYFSLEEFKRSVSPDDPRSWVLKGETNSAKHAWWTHMFAPTAADVDKVYSNLSKDSLIGTQDIYIREYEPLVQLGTKVDGRPVTQEYRFFCLYGVIVVDGFYWSEDFDEVRDNHPAPLFASPTLVRFVKDTVLPRIYDKVNFVVVDVGITQDGRPRVIELNDGQMSGLSMCDPGEFYSFLWDTFEGNNKPYSYERMYKPQGG